MVSVRLDAMSQISVLHPLGRAESVSSRGTVVRLACDLINEWLLDARRRVSAEVPPALWIQRSRVGGRHFGRSMYLGVVNLSPIHLSWPVGSAKEMKEAAILFLWDVCRSGSCCSLLPLQWSPGWHFEASFEWDLAGSSP